MLLCTTSCAYIFSATAQIIVISLAILSTLPHQEPRFLCPIVLPIFVLVATSTQWPRKTFWVGSARFTYDAIVMDFCRSYGSYSIWYLRSCLVSCIRAGSFRRYFIFTLGSPTTVRKIPASFTGRHTCRLAVSSGYPGKVIHRTSLSLSQHAHGR